MRDRRSALSKHFLERKGGPKHRKRGEKKSVFDLDETPSFVDPEFDKMEESDDSIVERVRNHGRLY